MSQHIPSLHLRHAGKGTPLNPNPAISLFILQLQVIHASCNIPKPLLLQPNMISNGKTSAVIGGEQTVTKWRSSRSAMQDLLTVHKTNYFSFEKKGDMMTTRNKIPAVYLNDETHQAMRKWSEYQGITMPKLAQLLLEEMYPVLEQMIETYEEIMAGADKERALNQLLIKGLTIATNKLNEDIEDVTDDRQGGKPLHE